SCLFILHCIGVQRAIHSFPTRRSSDLVLSAISLFGIGVYILLNLFRKNIKKLFYGSVLFIVAVICFGLPLAKKINPNTDYRGPRSEEHTSELQSRENLVCRLLLEKKKK